MSPHNNVAVKSIWEGCELVALCVAMSVAARRGLLLLLLTLAASPMSSLQLPTRTGAVKRVTPMGRRSAPRMLAALPAAAIGGTFAGGLHAISGPDHLAALLPLCTGRRWFLAGSTGAIWGIGHGLGAALVGALGFALRGAFNIDAVSSYMEVAVGVSIIIIGFNGFREAREWADAADTCTIADSPSEDDSATTSPGSASSGRVDCVELARDAAPDPAVVQTLGNGILNGVSGTGHVLGVMPALAMPRSVPRVLDVDRGRAQAARGQSVGLHQQRDQLAARAPSPASKARHPCRPPSLWHAHSQTPTVLPPPLPLRRSAGVPPALISPALALAPSSPCRSSRR